MGDIEVCCTEIFELNEFGMLALWVVCMVRYGDGGGVPRFMLLALGTLICFLGCLESPYPRRFPIYYFCIWGNLAATENQCVRNWNVEKASETNYGQGKWVFFDLTKEILQMMA